ncbi:MAG: ROK family protein [Bifidobacteriaceae bacterium]|jgi:polyphosphate glucokinase|nr:ROK family protein [Bifidobacteriaceae bacterium]MCI1915488.1 ROK family protein [Bifidobacteriaceae bacterium]
MIAGAQAFGIDIGGSGIKGAPVDLVNGRFAADRTRIPTPEVSTPEAVAGIVTQLLDQYEVEDGTPVGVAFPAPIKPGKPIDYMANLDQSWVGVDINQLLTQQSGREIHVVNDADAAGLAEVQYGAAKGRRGLVIATTLGTGIGTALIIDGILVPNTELGHLELNGKDAEHYTSDAARSRKELSWEKWGARLTKYYERLEEYFSPELFVVGGGVSKKSEKFFKYIDIETPLVPAALLNDAGIIGAGYFASKQK